MKLLNESQPLENNAWDANECVVLQYWEERKEFVTHLKSNDKFIHGHYFKNEKKAYFDYLKRCKENGLKFGQY